MFRSSYHSALTPNYAFDRPGLSTARAPRAGRSTRASGRMRVFRYMVGCSALLLCSVAALAACLDPKDPSKYYYPSLAVEVQRSAAIVIGTIENSRGLTEDPADPEGITTYIYSVRIKRLLAGFAPSLFQMSVENNSGGYRMEVGETHLLFLTKHGQYFDADPCGKSAQLPMGNATLADTERYLRNHGHAS
jgi:hypothetical protein